MPATGSEHVSHAAEQHNVCMNDDVSPMTWSLLAGLLKAYSALYLKGSQLFYSVWSLTIGRTD